MPSSIDRETLARSLRAVLKATGVTAPEVAAKAKVDPKTMNNMLHGRFGASVDTIAKVAKVLHLQVWQLLMPGYIEVYLSDGDNLQKIVDAYLKSDDTGRHSIVSVAEMAARANKPAA